MKRSIFTTFFISVLNISVISAATLVEEATKRVTELESLVTTAKERGIDVQREECALWMANEFLMYADWDEKNIELNEDQYKTWKPYIDDAARLANELPDFEREEVIKMLNTAIEELEGVVDGRYIRRDVPKIDWQSIKPEGRQFVSDGRAVFLNNYFTKPLHQSNEYLSKMTSSSLSLGMIVGEDGGLSEMGKQRYILTEDNYSGNVLLWHGTAPKWIQEKEPNVEDGKRLFTHYDIDNPLIRKAWALTMKECVPIIKERRSADLGYILSNEPHWYTKANSWATGGVSQYTIEKFRKWLGEQHECIADLNTLWGTSFNSFDEVEITIPMAQSELTTPKGYDWQRYNMYRVTDWFTFLDGEVKRYDPDAKTHIKIIPHMFNEGFHDHGLDMEALYTLTDIVGNDAKIIKKNPYRNEPKAWESRYAFDWYEVALSYDFFHSVNPEGANVNSESHFLSASTYRDIYMTKEFTRTAYWFATLHGMNLSFSWFWAREEDGGIRKDLRKQREQFDNAMNSAYVASVVQQPRVANEVTKTYMDLNAFSPEIVQIQSQRRPIRLFYSECSVLNKPSTMESLHHLYERLYFEGTPLGYVTQNILNNQSIEEWDVVLVWDMEAVLESEIDALQGYLDRGGVVVIDDKSLKHDEYKRPHTKGITPSNGQIIRANSLDKQYVAAFKYADESSLPILTIDETNSVGADGCMWRTMKMESGSYLLSITNLGRSDATITVGIRDGEVDSIREQFLGVEVENGFVIPSEQTMLMEVIATNR